MSILNTSTGRFPIDPTPAKTEPVVKQKAKPVVKPNPAIDLTKGTKAEYEQVRASLKLLNEGVELWGQFLQHEEVTVEQARELVMMGGAVLIGDLWATGVVPKPEPIVSAEELARLRDLDERHSRGDFRQGNY